MKSLSWFRLYSEAVDDSKLRLLAFEDRWHFVALLCCKAKGLLDGEDADLRTRKVCVTLGLDERELGEVARRLAAVGLIERETYQPLAWDHRQFISDHDPTAANRQKKWRENKRLQSVTDMSRVTLRTRNGRVTASETETETETEVKKKVETNVSTSPSSDDDGHEVAVAGIKKASYRLPDCPYQTLVDVYHETLPALPRVEVLSDQRKRHLQARWRQVCADEKLDRAAGLQWFRDFFEHVGKSAFLTGKTSPSAGRRPFVSSLDWLMNPEKFVHVYEGRYHR